MASQSIDLEIFHNLMMGISEHMSATVERTAFTSFVKETHDFGAAVSSRDGAFFSYPRQTGVTSFVGLDVGDAIRAIPDIEEGDIIFTNDPYNSGALCSHLPDLHMFRPVFMDGELLCFTWGFIHSSDIGGKVAGSISPTSYEVFQEGLRIPPMKMYRRGELNEDFKRIMQANVRIPTHVWGDLQALRASFHVAETQILRVARRFGAEKFLSMAGDVMDYSEAKSRQIIEQIPDGQYEFTDYLEDDFVSQVPVRLHLTLTKSGSTIDLDYTGTDPQVMAAINIPTLGKKHAWITVAMIHYLLSEDPSMPVNGGMVRPISVTAPSGTLVNPVFPASFGARVIAGVKMLEVTLGALGKAVPERVPAAGSGQGMIVVLATPDMQAGGQRVNVLEPLIGGSGGRPKRDGFDGSDYTFAFLRNTPIEVAEAENPILMREYSFRRDSGGPGKFRGGMGIGMEFQTILPHTRITARGMERTKFAPWGTQGGMHGMRTAPCTVTSAGGGVSTVAKIDILEFEPGDIVRIESSGAGGYGDPLTRDVAHVQRDVVLGFVSREQARVAYGVVFIEGTTDVDEPATAAERAERAHQTAGRLATNPYDFGPERLAFEARWPAGLHDELLGMLEQYPPLARGTVKNWVVSRALASPKERLDRGDLQRLWDECEAIFQKA